MSPRSTTQNIVRQIAAKSNGNNGSSTQHRTNEGWMGAASTSKFAEDDFEGQSADATNVQRCIGIQNVAVMFDPPVQQPCCISFRDCEEPKAREDFEVSLHQ